jgi:cytochrome c553
MNRRLREWSVGAALLVVALGVAGALVAASGVVPIKASSGHFAITEWILQFGKRRSIATHTIGMVLPPLDGPALVLKGAGHYDNGCRPCHGSPDASSPRIAAAMTPPPPDLAPIVAAREPEELFYVVKHGIKFTGMPAWPSQRRDDEVHAMVAFLLELPKLEAASYRRLAQGEGPQAYSPLSLQDLAPPVSRIVATSCARCHGHGGNGRGLGAFPKLAGQRQDYLLRALEAYAKRERHSGIMEPAAAALDPAQRTELAHYYSLLSPHVADSEPEHGTALLKGAKRERGEEIALRGIPSQGVPSCVDCHGPGPHRRNAAYPNLAGQYAEYLALQLTLFKNDQRGGSAYAHIMRHVAIRLHADQMRDVASYYASLSTRDQP